MTRGAYRHLVAVQNPGTPVADGDGGYTEAWTPEPAVPDWWVSMASATSREAVAAASVQATGTRLIQGDYRADVSLRSRLVFKGRGYLGSYRERVIADGATNYWRLDEASATIAKDIVGGATGTISGGVTLNQPGALSDGNTAMTFDGATGKIQTAIRTLPATFSVEVWMKTTVLAPQVAFSNRVSGAIYEMFLGIDATGKVHFLFSGAAQIYSTSIVANGFWHHVVYTMDGVTTLYKIFVDGQEEASNPIVVGVITSVWNIGFDPPAGNNWNGTLDEVAIYSRALTATEIAAHYTLGTQTFQDRLLYVTDAQNLEERDVTWQLTCEERIA